MRRAIAAILVLGVLVGACGEDESPTPPSPDGFDADRAFRDVEAQVAFGPRPSGSVANRKQAEFLAGALRDAGATGVQIQRPYANVVGTIPGSEPDATLLGAHHDTKDLPGFVGANDGASGVAVVLELARALPARVVASHRCPGGVLRRPRPVRGLPRCAPWSASGRQFCPVTH